MLETARARALWPSLRAFLITLAMLLGLIAGLPLPTGTVREGLPQSLLSVLDAIASGQRAVLSPVRFASDEFALIQRWPLFSGAGTSRYWLSLEARERRGKAWKVLYRPHDPKHAFLDSELEYRRVRGSWNSRRGELPPGYPAFASWVSERVFRARPKVFETRVRMEKIEILPRGAGFRGTGEFLHELRHARGKVLE